MENIPRDNGLKKELNFLKLKKPAFTGFSVYIQSIFKITYSLRRSNKLKFLLS